MMEAVDIVNLKFTALGRAGSSPATRTNSVFDVLFFG